MLGGASSSLGSWKAFCTRAAPASATESGLSGGRELRRKRFPAQRLQLLLQSLIAPPMLLQNSNKYFKMAHEKDGQGSTFCLQYQYSNEGASDEAGSRQVQSK